ncbi:hypothetical protein D3C73_1015830 [compost metagenome]
MATQGVRGLLDIIASGAVTPASVFEHVAQHVIRQVASVAGQMPLQNESQRLNLVAVFKSAVEPVRAIGREWHLSFPQRIQRSVQLLFRQAVGEPAAGAAAIQAKHQAGHFRRAAMFVGPQVQTTMVAMHATANPLHRRALRSPDQRAVGEQPHRAALVARHGRLHRAEQLFVRELRPQIEPRRVSQVQDRRFNGAHGE